MRKFILFLILVIQLIADTQLQQLFKVLQEQARYILPVKLAHGEIYALNVSGNTLTLKLRLSQNTVPNPCNTPLVQDVIKHNGKVEYVINDNKTLICK